MEKKISTGEAVKRVMREIGEFRTPSVLTPIMMIGEVVVETLIPLLMASIIDNGINKGDMKHILLVGGGMLILALTGLFFGVMGGVYGAKASTGFARNLRRAMFTNIETF